MKQKSKDIETQMIQAINDSGRSLNSLSIESGINRAMISRLLNGKRTITLSSAAKLAKVLGLELRPVEGSDHVA